MLNSITRHPSMAAVMVACLLAVIANRPASGRIALAPLSPQAAVSLDACTLLTRAEVQTATKKTVQAPAKSQVANLASCAFGDPNDATSKVVKLAVLVTAKPADAKQALSIGKSNAADVQPVPGLGDEAYWDKYLRTLFVVKGRYQVDVALDSEAGGLETAKALAARVLPRLPN